MKPAPAPWYSEEAGFFGPDYLKEYQSGLTRERTQAEVTGVLKMLRLTRHASILDCPCGHGRHAIELARRGYRVTGQDLNGYFLATAKRAAAKARVKVRWVKGDMRKIPFFGEFDAAVNLFTAFGYFETDEEDQLALDAAARALKPGGQYLLDVINRDRVLRQYRPQAWQRLADGSLVVTNKRYDLQRGRNEETRTHVAKNGRQKTFSLSVRMYTLPELVTMLKRAGLTVTATYGDHDASPLTLDAHRLIVVAKKG